MRIAIRIVTVLLVLAAAPAGVTTMIRPDAMAVPAASAAAASGPAVDYALRDEQRALEKADFEIESLYAQQNWFVILFSVVVGLFGTLVTARMIFFSLRFGW
jgi:hypothetical protein